MNKFTRIAHYVALVVQPIGAIIGMYAHTGWLVAWSLFWFRFSAAAMYRHFKAKKPDPKDSFRA